MRSSPVHTGSSPACHSRSRRRAGPRPGRARRGRIPRSATPRGSRGPRAGPRRAARVPRPGRPACATLVSARRILSSSLRRSATSAPRGRVPARAPRARAARPPAVVGIVQRFHHPRADIVALPGGGQAAHLAERLLARRRMEGDVGERLVLHDPPRGRFFERASSSRQPASAFRRTGTSGLRLWILTFFQAKAGIVDVVGRVGNPLHLLVEPGAGLVRFSRSSILGTARRDG